MQSVPQRQSLTQRSGHGIGCRRLSNQANRCQARSRVVRVYAADPLKVMIFGAPASGKGTQCAKIVEKYGLVHISVGDLLRAEVKANSPAGSRAKSYMDKGELVPSEVVVDMVVDRLGRDDIVQNGWLLDGYPRSEEQAQGIEARNIKPDVFLQLEVPEDSLVERVIGRRTDPVTGDIYHLTFKPPPAEIVDRLEQRSDDTEDKVKTRLRVYNENLESVVKYYLDKAVTIKGDDGIEEVFGNICQAIDSKKST